MRFVFDMRLEIIAMLLSCLFVLVCNSNSFLHELVEASQGEGGGFVIGVDPETSAHLKALHQIK